MNNFLYQGWSEYRPRSFYTQATLSISSRFQVRRQLTEARQLSVVEFNNTVKPALNIKCSSQLTVTDFFEMVKFIMLYLTAVVLYSKVSSE